MSIAYFPNWGLLIAVCVFTLSCGTGQKVEIIEGRDNFIFNSYDPLSDKPVKVFTYRPEGDVQTMPILFVMHGVRRNADDYRDNWIDIADKYQLLVVTPEFSKEHFQGSRSYNLGGMFDEDGNPVDERLWSYSLIEPIFDEVLEMTGSEQTQYDIFGHSAGAQFTHRFFLFKGGLRANYVISANAGWYTMPDFDIEFPYGLKKTSIDEETLNNRLESWLLIQLGEEDNDPKHKYLRTTAEAMEQGSHRFERGHTFYEAAHKFANIRGVDFNWSIRTVPEVGHENARMAIDIAEHLYGE